MTVAMTIGRLAQAALVNIETVRYYQRLGLLEEPDKPADGYRRYAPHQIRRLQFIKRAQALGFTLAEVGDLLRLQTGHMCTDTRGLATRKLQLIDQRMAGLAAMRQTLADLIQQCDTEGADDVCPVIDALSGAPKTGVANPPRP